MKQPDFRDKHLYILIALFVACTFIYYFGELVNFFGWEAFRWNIWYTVHDPHRMLFLFPILYCSYYYRLRGALLSNIISLFIFLPRALFISPFPDPTLRMIIFVLFSTALSTLMALVLIDRDKRVKLPDQVRPVTKKYQNMPLTLLLIFVFMSAGILVAGYLFYSNYEKNYRTQLENQLSSIADLKAGELVQWRKERLGDANQFFKNPVFSSKVQRYFEHPDDFVVQEQLRSGLTKFQANYRYAGVFLLDTQGVGRIVAPETGPPLPLHTPKDAQQALQSGKVTILDLHRDEEGQRPHMAVITPLFREEDGNLPLGVVVMLIDPDAYLYPLINRWPTASTTAETLIVRRDGNDALFLNELRFQKDTALKLRIPLDKKDVPAVKAVLGQQGIVEGRDYRGEPVLADVRSIPDSPWFMVARMDMSEIYAPLAQVLWMVIALVSALLLGAGAGVVMFWRQQNIRVYKERAESAEALSASESRYRELFENASLAVFRSTLEGKVLAVNPKFASIFGYKSQEEVVATIKDIAADLYVDPHRREEIARLSKDNPDLNKFEVLYRRRDGSTFWGELTLRIATESDGATFLEGFIEDITERKKTQEALKESEKKHRAVVEMASDVIVIIQDGMIRFANPRVTTMFGYETGEIEGMKFVSFIPPENLGLALERYQKRMAGEKLPEIYATELLHKSGRKISVETSGGVIEYAGKPADLAIIRDITERKHAEQAIRESEAQYRLLSEHMTDTLWLMDMQLKTTYQSPSAAKLRGYTPQEILELPLEEHATPESLKLAFEVLSEEIPRVKADPDYNPIRTLELEYYRKDGTTVWTENKFSVIRDENGQPVSILAEARDITERKQAEEKLEKSYESLKKTLNDAIDTMAKIVETRDPYTAGHQQRVAGLANAIAREMKLEDSRIDQLRMAAVIHDIGKMYVPSDILSKPGRLSDIEFSLIRTHAQSGYDIIEGMDFPCNIAKAILQHHERLDGSGYPNQLKGEDTLLEAKILSVADVIEAMASHRPYRAALGIDKALEEISKNRGRLYDPDVVDACLEVFNSGKFEFKAV